MKLNIRVTILMSLYKITKTILLETKQFISLRYVVGIIAICR